jgi:hypothetical protein
LATASESTPVAGVVPVGRQCALTFFTAVSYSIAVPVFRFWSLPDAVVARRAHGGRVWVCFTMLLGLRHHMMSSWFNAAVLAGLRRWNNIWRPLCRIVTNALNAHELAVSAGWPRVARQSSEDLRTGGDGLFRPGLPSRCRISRIAAEI